LSPTSNTGNPDPLPEHEDTLEELDEESRPIPLKLLIFASAVVILACVIGVPVIGVFYTIVFPPAPTVPDGAVEISHTSTDYGVDDWLYITSQPACEVVEYFVDQGAQCRFAPNCDQPANPDSSPNAENANVSVARCIGEKQVSIFEMRWQVVVAVNENLRTEFRLQREVFWTGSAPPLQQPEAP